MSLLLDTHVLLWSLTGSPKLSPAIRNQIEEAETILVSAVSLWEFALKVRLGKLDADVGRINAAISVPGTSVRLLPITPAHLETLQTLPRIEGHNDPFDHLLIAQAICERVPFISRDAWAANYPVQLLTP